MLKPLHSLCSFCPHRQAFGLWQRGTRLFAVFVVCVVWVGVAPAWAMGLFGSVEFKAASLQALPQWVRVLEKLPAEQKIFRQCDINPATCKSPAMMVWRGKLKTMASLPPIKQLQAVNTFANQWVYRYDDEAWGSADYWATPFEFLRNSGDCEDYAIFKYVSLRHLGFMPENLRIVVVRDTIRNTDHAVLMAVVDNIPYILDSLFTAVLPHTDILQYVPHYSVNEQFRWAHVMPLKNK